jgi:DNA-binding helix-hairpin-helix protein with protein kinase domain
MESCAYQAKCELHPPLVALADACATVVAKPRAPTDVKRIYWPCITVWDCLLLLYSQYFIVSPRC